MKTPRKRKRRRKSINILLRLAILGSLCAAVTAAADSTVIAGSVFRDPGFALPEATVTLVRRDDPKHKKLAEESTTYRGEFVFHVPPTPAVYVVKASAKGYQPVEKEAAVTGTDRIDLTFTLEPQTKK
jgi:Carboxypeptidase regulatory-like domain